MQSYSASQLFLLCVDTQDVLKRPRHTCTWWYSATLITRVHSSLPPFWHAILNSWTQVCSTFKWQQSRVGGGVVGLQVTLCAENCDAVKSAFTIWFQVNTHVVWKHCSVAEVATWSILHEQRALPERNGRGDCRGECAARRDLGSLETWYSRCSFSHLQYLMRWKNLPICLFLFVQANSRLGLYSLSARWVLSFRLLSRGCPRCQSKTAICVYNKIGPNSAGMNYTFGVQFQGPSLCLWHACTFLLKQSVWVVKLCTMGSPWRLSSISKIST